MNNLKLGTLVFCLLFSTTAMADKASEAEAAKLLDTMDMQTALEHVIDVMLDAQIQQKPEMAPYKDVMHAFFSKYMSYSALKPQFVTTYATEFSASELSEARAFYSTPTGKKFLSKMPTLMSKGGEIGTQSVKDHIPELQEAIRKESERLQTLQQASKQP